MKDHRLERRALRSFVVGTVAIAGWLAAIVPAYPEGWCAAYKNGGNNCTFTSYSQCLAALAGMGGFCLQDPSASVSKAGPARESAKPAAEPKRKQVRTRPSPAVPSPAPAAVAPQTVTAAVVPQIVPPARPLPAQFGAARQLVFDGQYDAALVALQALRQNDHPEVAAYVGLAYRGLGRVAEARAWYDQALLIDPNHRLALLFDGMLRAEQGDLRVARDNLERIRRLCGGTACSEYEGLEEAIAGVRR